MSSGRRLAALVALALAVSLAVVAGAVVYLMRPLEGAPSPTAATPNPGVRAASIPDAGEATYVPPDLATAPAGPLGDAIRRGHELVTRTHETLPDHVGNGLHCTSCHLEGGTKPGAAPWVGLPAAFPEYRARSGRVDTLDRRVNDCFERSMNGTALDPASPEMAAILAYMSFLSRGVPAGTTPGRGFRRIADPPAPDRARGAAIYAERCASCHGADGSGRTNEGAYLFPAVGGPRSFNLGAGMARLDTAAAYVRWNMPLGMGGSLDDQEAYDVAEFVIHLERPDWARKDQDWPSGGRPRDARY